MIWTFIAHLKFMEHTLSRSITNLNGFKLFSCEEIQIRPEYVKFQSFRKTFFNTLQNIKYSDFFQSDIIKSMHICIVQFRIYKSI